jgi:hypothetical protein
MVQLLGSRHRCRRCLWSRSDPAPVARNSYPPRAFAKPRTQRIALDEQQREQPPFGVLVQREEQQPGDRVPANAPAVGAG